MLSTRRIPWAEVPADLRVNVMPFLSVYDCLTLDVALTTTKDRLREELTKAYQTVYLPAFDTYPFTDKDDFKGLRWVMRAGVKLHSVTLSLEEKVEEGKAAVRDVDDVLWHLVKREIPDIAGLYVEKSKANDVTRLAAGNLVSTLWLAAQAGYTAVVRALVKRGADVDRAEKDGMTSLYVASFYGHMDVARLLLDAGADVDRAQKDGMTLLYTASRNGHADVARLLLDAGADVDRAQKDGKTPLYTASANGYADVVEILLKGGADPTIVSNDGKLPHDVTRQSDIRRLITQSQTGR